MNVFMLFLLCVMAPFTLSLPLDKDLTDMLSTLAEDESSRLPTIQSEAAKDTGEFPRVGNIGLITDD